jgi:hypothetical protein
MGTYEAWRQIFPFIVHMRRQQGSLPYCVQETRDDVVEKGWLAGTRVVSDRYLFALA